MLNEFHLSIGVCMYVWNSDHASTLVQNMARQGYERTPNKNDKIRKAPKHQRQTQPLDQHSAAIPLGSAARRRSPR